MKTTRKTMSFAGSHELDKVLRTFLSKNAETLATLKKSSLGRKSLRSAFIRDAILRRMEEVTETGQL